MVNQLNKKQPSLAKLQTNSESTSINNVSESLFIISAMKRYYVTNVLFLALLALRTQNEYLLSLVIQTALLQYLVV